MPGSYQPRPYRRRVVHDNPSAPQWSQRNDHSKILTYFRQGQRNQPTGQRVECATRRCSLGPAPAHSWLGGHLRVGSGTTPSTGSAIKARCKAKSLETIQSQQFSLSRPRKLHRRSKWGVPPGLKTDSVRKYSRQPALPKVASLSSGCPPGGYKRPAKRVSAYNKLRTVNLRGSL